MGLSGLKALLSISASAQLSCDSGSNAYNTREPLKLEGRGKESV